MHDTSGTTPPPPLAAYLAARYRVVMPDGIVTLRIGMQPERPISDTAPWAIVSAANPGSWPGSVTANAARHADLVACVRALARPWYPARNAAEDGSWPEESVALQVSAAMADGLARHYGQAASVYVPVAAPPRLRCLRPDWRPGAGATRMDVRFVDWLP